MRRGLKCSTCTLRYESSPPPRFLAQRYKRVVGLISEAATRAELADRLDATHAAENFRDFEALFSAEDEALKAALAPNIKGNHGKVEALDRLVANVKRLLVFEDLDTVSGIIRTKLREVVQAFPRSLKQLEEGDDGRDVLDPFIVALGLRLMRDGSIEGLLRDLVAHKCLMKLEDLIGHMHEEVLGRAAGKERVAEPEGVVGADGKKNKEAWDRVKNPYPGADARLGEVEFYQIKNKTGSAKGSDGEKLGRQFRLLGEHYPKSKRFYVSMIGKTLAGHRSMGAFLRTDPEAVVLVGLAAFQQLGGHRDTPSIVLDLVLEEFESVRSELHYDLDAVAKQMTAEWNKKHGTGDPAHRLLRDMITNEDPADQQSPDYLAKRRR